MDLATTATMNEIFQNNLNVIVDNFSAAQGAGSRLLLGLATIEFLLLLYKGFLSRGEDLLKSAVEKLFLIFVVALLTFNWGAVAGFFKGYIVGGGAAAGGASQMVTSLNPAYIASDGFDKVAVIFNAEAQRKMLQDFYDTDSSNARRKADRARAQREQEKGFFDRASEKLDGMSPSAMMESMTDAGEQIVLQIVAALLFCTLAILIILVHFYVALQVFVLAIDWYLTVSLTQLLIPFAVNKYTSGLASAALNAVVQKSFQLAVLVAILGMFGNSIQGLGLGPSPTLVDILSLLLGSLTLAFMVSRAPQIAGSIFAGAGNSVDVGNSLSAAAAGVGQLAAAAASSGVSAAASGVGAGAQLAGQGLSAGASRVSSGVSAGAQLAGQGLDQAREHFSGSAGLPDPSPGEKARAGHQSERAASDDLTSRLLGAPEGSHLPAGPVQVGKEGEVSYTPPTPMMEPIDTSAPFEEVPPPSDDEAERFMQEEVAHEEAHADYHASYEEASGSRPAGAERFEEGGDWAPPPYLDEPPPYLSDEPRARSSSRTRGAPFPDDLIPPDDER